MTHSSPVCFQLTREVPPGYGGVERFVHIISITIPSTVFSLRSHFSRQDPLPVSYERILLPTLYLWRLFFPLPSLHLFRLLFSTVPLVAHLPCPTVLLILTLARVFRPKRKVVIFWHAFLQPADRFSGFFERIYQYLALCVARRCVVITTSTILRQSLLNRGLDSDSVQILPCALSPGVENSLKRLRTCPSDIQSKGRVIFIGRLNTYKRVDWLIQAIAMAPAVFELHVLGDGPALSDLKKLVHTIIEPPQRVFFHGTVTENKKQQLLAFCDLMVLPSDRCNEAFGIVQLEAMAAGIPSLAFDLPDSGMNWVSDLESLNWSASPSDLAVTLQRIFTDSSLLVQLSLEARERYDRVFSNKQWIRSLCNLQLLLKS